MLIECVCVSHNGLSFGLFCTQQTYCVRSGVEMFNFTTALGLHVLLKGTEAKCFHTCHNEARGSGNI